MNFTDVRNNRQIIKVEWIGRFTCTYSLHVSCFLRQYICWVWVWLLDRSLRGIQTELQANLQSKIASWIRYLKCVRFWATITIIGQLTLKCPFGVYNGKILQIRGFYFDSPTLLFWFDLFLKVRQNRNDFFKLMLSRKNEQTNSISLLRELILFIFWRKLKTPKRHFEINWPLEATAEILENLVSFFGRFEDTKRT